MKPPSLPTFQQLHQAGVSPSERGDLHHQWYQYLAHEYRDPAWMFMNFGYAEVAPPGTAPAAAAGYPLSSCARLYTQLAEQLEPRGKRLLEVGCGRGGGAFTVMRRFKPASLHAIDRSDEAIALCRQQYKVPGLEFHHGSAEALPFPDASFDAVLNVESSHAYAHFDRFAAEVARVLVPGGKFAIADIRPPAELDHWRELLQNPGFQIVTERDITQNALAALQLTHDFKMKYVTERVALTDRDRFLEFSATVGSWYFEALRGNRLRYWQFVLRKPDR